jgi:hypothetical protein
VFERGHDNRSEFSSVGLSHVGGVLDMEATVGKLLIL